MEKITITTDFITLDGFLKYAGWVDSGAHAKECIKDKKVLVNGVVEIRRGRKLYDGDIVKFQNFKAKVAHPS